MKKKLSRVEKLNYTLMKKQYKRLKEQGLIKIGVNTPSKEKYLQIIKAGLTPKEAKNMILDKLSKFGTYNKKELKAIYGKYQAEGSLTTYEGAGMDLFNDAGKKIGSLGGGRTENVEEEIMTRFRSQETFQKGLSNKAAFTARIDYLRSQGVNQTEARMQIEEEYGY